MFPDGALLPSQRGFTPGLTASEAIRLAKKKSNLTATDDCLLVDDVGALGDNGDGVGTGLGAEAGGEDSGASANLFSGEVCFLFFSVSLFSFYSSSY